MIRRHKVYFLTPLFFLLILLVLLAYYLGPAVVVTFIYAGI